MSLMTERRHAGEHIIREMDREGSREQIIIGGGQDLLAGRVLGRITVGALTAAAVAVAGNVGAQTITAAPAVAAGTPVGDYDLVAVSAGATAKFVMFSTTGKLLGVVTTGTPATLGGIGPFTITDAGVDPAEGDRMRITVTAAANAANGQYVAHNPAATDGSQVAAAILFDAVKTEVGKTAKAVGHVRICDVNKDLLAWGAHDTSQKAAALAQLAASFVIAR